MLKLKGFRVTEFRSVQDSGWIETDDVTALIGTNESGKTNLLIAPPVVLLDDDHQGRQFADVLKKWAELFARFDVVPAKAK